MNIYVLARTDGCYYDEADGFVVAAMSSSRARSLAAERAGDEGGGTWLETSRSTIRKIGSDSPLKDGVVLRSYNAG